MRFLVLGSTVFYIYA